MFFGRMALAATVLSCCIVSLSHPVLAQDPGLEPEDVTRRAEPRWTEFSPVPTTSARHAHWIARHGPGPPSDEGSLVSISCAADDPNKGIQWANPGVTPPDLLMSLQWISPANTGARMFDPFEYPELGSTMSSA